MIMWAFEVQDFMGLLCTSTGLLQYKHTGDLWRQCMREINKGTRDHYASLTFVRDSWYLPWTWSIAYIQYSTMCSHTTGAKNLTSQYKIITSFERCLNQWEMTTDIMSSEDRIYIATGRKVFSDNGMINTWLIESSKGYSISKWPVSFSQCWHPVKDAHHINNNYVMFRS